MSNKIELPKYYVACLSGGKDSLYMFAHILNNLDKYPLNAVVHYELEIDYPWVTDVIEYVESKCKLLKIPVYRIKPRKTWTELFNKYGYPSRQNRWCNGQYKMDCFRQLTQMFKDKANVITYLGICRNEEKRIKKTENIIYPLFEMGVFENTIWEWAKNQPIFNDYYRYNRRQGCIGCPLSSMQNDKYNSMYYPFKYQSYMKLAYEWEKQYKLKTGKALSVWQGNSKYDTEYRMKRIEQMELKEIERW